MFQNLLTGLRHSGTRINGSDVSPLWFQNLLTGLRHSGHLVVVYMAKQALVSKPSNRSKAFRAIILRGRIILSGVSKPSNRSKAFRG